MSLLSGNTDNALESSPTRKMRLQSEDVAANLEIYESPQTPEKVHSVRFTTDDLIIGVDAAEQHYGHSDNVNKNLAKLNIDTKSDVANDSCIQFVVDPVSPSGSKGSLGCLRKPTRKLSE